MKAVAVILAAGAARKMAFPKALIEHEGGRSFLQSLASTFGKAGCAVLAVVGKDADAVRAQHPTLELVESERWETGPVASMKAGIRVALTEGAEAILLHPVDMPSVRTSTLKTLVAKLEGADAVRPEFEGAPGFPVVLSREGADRMLAAEDAGNLDAAVRPLSVRKVAVKDPGVIVNINTPETYERLFGSEPRLAPPPKRRNGKKATEHVS